MSPAFWAVSCYCLEREMGTIQNLLFSVCWHSHQHYRNFPHKFTPLDPKHGLHSLKLQFREPLAWLIGVMRRNLVSWSFSSSLAPGLLMTSAPSLTPPRHTVSSSEDKPGPKAQSAGPLPASLRFVRRLTFPQGHLSETNFKTSAIYRRKDASCNFSLAYQAICVWILVNSF